MTQLLRNTQPALMAGAKILASEILGIQANPWSSFWYVDGDGGSSSASGNVPEAALDTIQGAITAAGRGDLVYVRPKAMGSTATDPSSYTENVVVPVATDGLSIIGASFNRTQNGLPQLKVGTTTTDPLLKVKAMGCYIAGLGINGNGGTGSGISLYDDAGVTACTAGTTIENCHFKNCVGTTATNAATGGAIYVPLGTWQIRVRSNRFYKNVGDIVLASTSTDVAQDWVIEDNIFSGPAASVDCNIYTGGGGVNGIIIQHNTFQADPAIGSASNGNFLMLTASVGILADNFFACITEEADTEITFGATGVNKVPTTVFMAGNFGEWGTAGAPGVGSGEIFRT